VFLGAACGLIFHANEGGMLIVFVSVVAWQVAKQTQKRTTHRGTGYEG